VGRLRLQGMGLGRCVAWTGSDSPRTSAKAAREVKGFRTGDMVQSVVPSGKRAGIHIGKVAVRASGSFNVSTSVGVVQGISHKTLFYATQGGWVFVSIKNRRSSRL